jgi:hypothetical protein
MLTSHPKQRRGSNKETELTPQFIVRAVNYEVDGFENDICSLYKDFRKHITILYLFCVCVVSGFEFRALC